MGRERSYPQWFIDDLAQEEDREQARNGAMPTTCKPKFLCAECGQVYTQKVTAHITLSTGEAKVRICPSCSRQRQRLGKRLNTQFYPQWFVDDLALSADKERAKAGSLRVTDRALFRCLDCGNEYEALVSSHITVSTGARKKGCPKCGVQKQVKARRENKGLCKPYPQWFIDSLYLPEDRERAKSETFYGGEAKQFFCPKHNLVYKKKVGAVINPRTHERKVAGCPACSMEKRRKTLGTDAPLPPWFVNDLVREEDRERARSGSICSNEHLLFKCNAGHLYTQEVHAHIKLSTQESICGCPICAKMRSKAELEVEAYIRSLGISTEHRRFQTESGIPIEADIYLPSKSIAIEYNGSYWHKTLPMDGNTKARSYHQSKYLAFRNMGIRLISIFDVDWEASKDKIKACLKDILFQPIKVYARKCTIKHLRMDEANAMYSAYHLLGAAIKQGVSYGIYWEGELVSCMTFQNSRYTSGHSPVWCLSRFVTKPGISVIGGASRMLKAFMRDHHPDSIVSYSDNDYFSGGIYSMLGFKCLGATYSPRYYWWLDGHELKRESCQLGRLKAKFPELYVEALQSDAPNKEDYIMLALGAFKVFRSGHTKWLWEA